MNVPLIALPMSQAFISISSLLSNYRQAFLLPFLCSPWSIVGICVSAFLFYVFLHVLAAWHVEEFLQDYQAPVSYSDLRASVQTCGIWIKKNLFCILIYGIFHACVILFFFFAACWLEATA